MWITMNLAVERRMSERQDASPKEWDDSVQTHWSAPNLSLRCVKNKEFVSKQTRGGTSGQTSTPSCEMSEPEEGLFKPRPLSQTFSPGKVCVFAGSWEPNTMCYRLGICWNCKTTATLRQTDRKEKVLRDNRD